MVKKHANILSHFSNREMKSKNAKRYHYIPTRFTKMRGSLVLVMIWSNVNSLKTTITLENSLPFFSKFEEVHTQQPSHGTPKYTPFLVVFCVVQITLCPSVLCFLSSKMPWQWRSHCRRFEGRRKMKLGIYSFMYLFVKSLDQRSQLLVGGLLHTAFSAPSPGSAHPSSSLQPRAATEPCS